MRLESKVALITGGGSGIGRACAEMFAREGARVAVSDISLERAQATTQFVTSHGGDAIAISGDVSVGDDAQNMVSATVEKFGKLDVLVNSAGVSARNAMPKGSSPEEVWDKVIDVNLKGTYMVSWHAMPEMAKSGGGSIINLSSIMGLVGYPVGMGGGFNPYNPSKGGVLQFTRNLAIDSASKNVRVNCICPGYVETDLTSALTKDAEALSRLETLHPIGRLGQPEEIAYAALYLASDESGFVTGTPLVVDGGYTAQ
ncbi:MAG TPA: glucose 1-dehydrogenase [Dehalococcoidia bacterium]|jgi:NAD(P)-dependent dehydrogenase (short-subunit alcohol dehydrogenase family)|nr:short-chain dehydrogenase [Dehalococcoidia bacterium]HHZ61421.1 glucose 1-dehydrogenase [Dehalococcoidia bacterium]HIO62641.1 glucose 1-dehydrogenase [Dehalococcoidia bacterium]